MKLVNREALLGSDSFKKHGAVIVENVIDDTQIELLRKELYQYNETHRTVHIPAIFKHQQVANIFFSPQVIKRLREIFGDKICFHPSFQVQVNSFTQDKLAKISSGLHADASKEVEQGQKYMTNDTPSWVNIGCYLQSHDNNGWGGGVAIVPKSHIIIRILNAVPVLGGTLNKIFIAACRRKLPEYFMREIPTKAGDALIFDNRLLHTSVSGPKAKSNQQQGNGMHQTFLPGLPEEDSKYAFYWFCGRTDDQKSVFYNNFVVRAEGQIEPAPGAFNYKEVVSVNFPQQYPENFVECANNYNIPISSAS